MLPQFKWPGLASHATNTVTKNIHDFKSNINVRFSLLFILQQSSSSIAWSSGWSIAPWTVANHGRRCCIYTWAKLLVVMTVEQEAGARHPLLSLRSSCQLEKEQGQKRFMT